MPYSLPMSCRTVAVTRAYRGLCTCLLSSTGWGSGGCASRRAYIQLVLFVSLLQTQVLIDSRLPATALLMNRLADHSNTHENQFTIHTSQGGQAVSPDIAIIVRSLDTASSRPEGRSTDPTQDHVGLKRCEPLNPLHTPAHQGYTRRLLDKRLLSACHGDMCPAFSSGTSC